MNHTAHKHSALPAWAINGIVYQVNVRQYTREGTFRAFAAYLPRLKELGVNILYFMPIHPIGRIRRKGSLGSYYAVQDYFSINPEFGTMEDFRELVRAAHAQGMRVLIDLVANHTAWDNPMLNEHPEWYHHDKNGKITSPLAEWSDAAELDYRQVALRQHMTEVMLYWLREADIDGYRCDVAEMVPYYFWRRAIGQAKRLKPLLMIAEGQNPRLHRVGFHVTYAFNMAALFNDIAAGVRSPREIDYFLELDHRLYPPTGKRLRYTCNHDLNSWLGPAVVRLGQAARVFAVLTFTLPGMPFIYNGQEIGSTKSLAFFDKDEIDWKPSEWFDFYRRLCRAYREHPALYSGKMERLKDGNSPLVYGFVRNRPNDCAVILANLCDRPMHGAAEGVRFKGSYLELFTSEKTALNGRVTYALQPWEVRVYLKENV
ncbi:MAG: alpha-amylase family glycosyl hydrolase [candidate division KSB1 bacterium]|nr:alpha-amylase family glycosyl hydrolase [candidate division KSB1 bacterium]